MHWGIRRLPVSGATLLRLLSAVALLAMVVSMGDAGTAAQWVDCYLDSRGCYGEGCGALKNQYIIQYAIDNYHCIPDFGDDWYEAEFRGCCANAEPQEDGW